MRLLYRLRNKLLWKTYKVLLSIPFLRGEAYDLHGAACKGWCQGHAA